MRVWKFEGATMRDAIAKVKSELGDQAVIISTRQVRRGLLGTAVEISAAIDNDDAEPAMPFANTSGPTTGGPVSGGPIGGGPAFAASAPAVTPQRAEHDVEKQLAPLRSELRSLRAMVRTAGDTKGTSELRSELAALRKLIEQLAPNQVTHAPQSAPAAAQPQTPARRAAVKAAQGNTPLVAPSTGSVIMLVGPTGAGKTTTIAKLAARAALIDNRRVGVITLDNYRVGGVEQIRTFTDLIGVPLAVADSPSQLANLIDPVNDLTLIDTAGKSPRDIASITELARCMQGLDIEVHLVVPAHASPAQIDELVQRYAQLGPVRLLFTKLDECACAPELALAPTRTRLSITWVTTGQAVPEDIEQPTSARVLELASTGLAHQTAPAPRNRSPRAA